MKFDILGKDKLLSRLKKAIKAENGLSLFWVAQSKKNRNQRFQKTNFIKLDS